MVTDGRLRKVYVLIEVDAVEPVVLLFDLAEDLEPCWVGKSFGNLFRLFSIHLRHMTILLQVTINYFGRNILVIDGAASTGRSPIRTRGQRLYPSEGGACERVFASGKDKVQIFGQFFAAIPILHI